MAIHFPPRRILVAMDFSPAAKSALRAAAALGKLFRARLELVCVQEPDSAPTSAGLLPGGQIFTENWRKERAARIRRRLRLTAEAAGLEAACHVPLGDPAGVLARLAAPPHADLFVMGARGSLGAGTAIFGSVAEAVVRRARVPVLAVHRRRGPLQPRRILCPVSLTPHSGRALACAAQLAERQKASLCALYVYDGFSEGEAWNSLKCFLRLSLGEAARRVEMRVVRGEPREEIVRAARGGFDLLVLGEHLRPWSTDRLLGTTAERALRQASIPVLAVPYDAARHPHWLTQARQVLRRPHII